MACLAPQFRWALSPSALAHHQSSVPSTSLSRCPGLNVCYAVTSIVVDGSRVDGSDAASPAHLGTRNSISTSPRNTPPTSGDNGVAHTETAEQRPASSS
jgi:hypothetical protein